MKKQANTSKPGDRLGKNLLLTGAAMAAAMMGAGAASAQTVPATGAASTDEEIVVTGTRIARPGTVSSSPIASVSEAELQLQQPSTAETVLRQLPQFAPGDGGQTNNGSVGAATVDLRGLTPTRTLVLVDGHRMPGFDPNLLFDVDTVPIALLRRIDIVTGGASAVYGSDAVAGVVNFVLNDNFQGVQFDYTRAQRMAEPYGPTNTYWMTIGSNLADGRGNVALAIGHSDREPLYQTFGPGSLPPTPSSTTNPPALDAAGGRVVFNSSGDLIPYVNSVSGFNFNPYNLYQSPQNRWTATAIANYEITPEIEAYSRFVFSSVSAQTQLAPSGTFGFTFEVPLNNPFLTAQASSYLAAHDPSGGPSPCSVPAAGMCVTVPVRWRSVQVGPRQYSFRYDTYQILGGFRGELGEGWEWDITAAHGETGMARTQRNDDSSTRIQQALFAVDANNCFDPTNGCVPLNIFNPTLPTSAASTDFVRFNLQLQATTIQDYVVASASGDVAAIHSPFAGTPLALAFGSEYRREESIYEPDAASQSGESPGFGQTLPIRGHFDVMEVFAEGILPLVENAPLAEELNLELGYRISDYDTSGLAETYKYGASWVPFHGLRIRGMYQQAIRNPNVAELFTPRTPGTGTLDADPCAAGTPGTPLAPGGFLYNLCLATGVPASALNGGTLPEPTSGQANNFAGGNPDLQPETAHTLTYGFVWQPTEMIPGLSLTVDYYNIKIDNAIAVRPLSDILDGCYSQTRNSTGDPNNADCLLIHRNVLFGNLEGDLIYGVEQLNQNLSEIDVEGIDISFNYQHDLGWGRVDIGFDGTHLLKDSYSPVPGQPLIDCIGRYGQSCGVPSTITASASGPAPENRWVQRTTLSIGDVDISYRWRHLSEAVIDTGHTGNISDSIPAFDYIDVAGVWHVTDTIRLSLGITNVTDKEAPFVSTGTGPSAPNSGNTYPSTYDALGRVVSFGISARF